MSDNTPAVLNYQPQVRAALETFIKNQQRAPSGGLVWHKDVTERLQTFATNGKLLRGCMVCYSYSLQSGAVPTTAVLNTAVAIELIHSSLLIHDDIIDRDDLRRGQPAMHAQYRQLIAGRPVADLSNFGNSMALCAGDMALFMAFGLLNTAGTDMSANASLGGLFSRALTATCAGQMEDAYQSVSSRRPSKRTIYSIMRCKTAAYSVALPLAAGAVLAGEPGRLQRELYKLGLIAGIIFQIRDDELGLFSQTSTLGKPIGSDIREAKKTLFYYYLWRSATAGEKRYLKTVFANANASETDIRTVQETLQRCQVPAQVKQDIGDLKQDAEHLINQLTVAPKAQDKLRQLVRFCTGRQF